MDTPLLRNVLGLGVLFLTCASCGPVPPEPQAGGGIGGTGSVTTVATGPVTKFGSVFVSGTEYDNTSAIYCIDDDPCSSENKLKLGMIVLVNGKATEEYSTGQSLVRIADKITFEETVEGIVQSVAADGLSLVVLGQVVHLDQKTIVDLSIPEQSIRNLRPGLDLVEVSGFVISDGHVLATLIMMQTGNPHYEVQGFIKNHDTKAKRFEIGALEVDYSSADISQMPSPSTSTWDGLVAHVRGDHWSPGGSGQYGANLTATRVKPIGLGVADSAEADVEGFILQADAPGDFLVNNLHVRTAASTVFEGGTVTDLVVGTRVEIHGSLVSGVLQAERVSFKDKVELESDVASINAGSRTLTVAGLPGLTIYVDDKTAIGGIADLRRFEDLAVGHHVKIYGRPAGVARLLATEIERASASAQVKFEGPVQSASDPVLAIIGCAIDTTGIPSDGFLGSNGTTIGRSTFFQSLTIGRKVSLKGTWTGGLVTWTSARLKK